MVKVDKTLQGMRMVYTMRTGMGQTVENVVAGTPNNVVADKVGGFLRRVADFYTHPGLEHEGVRGQIRRLPDALSLVVVKLLEG